MCRDTRLCSYDLSLPTFLIGCIIWNARHPFPKRTRPTYHCLSSLKASSHHDRPDPPIRPRSGDIISNAQQGAKKKKKNFRVPVPALWKTLSLITRLALLPSVQRVKGSEHRHHRLRRILFTRRWSYCTLLARSCYRFFIFGLGMGNWHHHCLP
ncbi:hypothetical protein BN1708_003660 [Verticillium longisporum]|uniref:Uncharacterized protein n=1 Tax=Verticillium longisporum TaxID=100787 RepID=A0A0G4LNY2_VERLO|nr:hypothetical protein BN1708_003660 [Verticillium longisporum]